MRTLLTWHNLTWQIYFGVLITWIGLICQRKTPRAHLIWDKCERQWCLLSWRNIRYPKHRYKSDWPENSFVYVSFLLFCNVLFWKAGVKCKGLCERLQLSLKDICATFQIKTAFGKHQKDLIVSHMHTNRVSIYLLTQTQTHTHTHITHIHKH